MAANIFTSQMTGAEVEEALRRAMSAVQTINGIHPSRNGNVFVEGVQQEGADGSASTVVSAVYTPYVQDGKLCWENNAGLENPEPVALADFLPSAVRSVNGKAPENGAVALTASDVGALPISGGVLTGNLDMNGQPISGLNEPTESTQAASKQYVDRMLPKSGGTMTGDIAMSDHKISNLGAPTADTDAVSKAYADGLLKDVPTPTEDGHAASKAYVDSFRPVLLWENAKPTSAFVAQTVPLDLTPYAFVAVKTGGGSVFLFEKDTSAQFASVMVEQLYYGAWRSCEVTDSGVIFGDGVKMRQWGVYTTENANVIPLKIYGIQ